MLEKLNLWFKVRKSNHDDIIHINKIKISRDFAATKPRHEKVILNT